MDFKVSKYTNYKYEKDIDYLIYNTKLSSSDFERLEEVYLCYKKQKAIKQYEPIIKDLFILSYKNKLATSYLAEIYKTGLRNMQIWLKELGLNKKDKKTNKTKVERDNMVHYNRIRELALKESKGHKYCIYRFLDKNDEVLYIGKCSKSFHYNNSKLGFKDYFIKDRIALHFSPSSKQNPKSLYLNTRKIEVIYPDVYSNYELEQLESALISYYERNQFQCKYNKDLNLSYEINVDNNNWINYYELTDLDIKNLLEKYNYKIIPKLEITNERLKAMLWIKQKIS